MGEPVTIHVVDDDDLVRDSLTDLLRSVGYAVRSYESATVFLSSPRKDEPGCVIVDVRMPGLSGLELQGAFGRLAIALPLIVMTGFGDVRMSVQAMKAGAIDFLEKPFRDQDMLDAIATALGRDLARRSVDAADSELKARYATLSPREQQVMKLVVAGKMNKQVAGDLGISEITVKIHRSAAMRKMGARTLADLIRMAEVVKRTHP